MGRNIMFVVFWSLLLLAASFPSAFAYTGPGDELFSFVTRPDLKPPRWNITYHDRSAIAPGYWFVSPYNFDTLGINDIKWEACIYGPTIYDNDGELVWSGACRFGNRITFDFKMDEFWDDEGVALSGIMQHANFPAPEKNVGAGFFLGSDYKIKQAVKIHNDWKKMDLHEFNVLEKGRRVLVITSSRKRFPAEPLGFLGRIPVHSNGFKEIDAETGETIFEWNAHGHMSLAESTHIPMNLNLDGRPESNWDPFHMNSVDKTESGDYLVSMRHCDVILLVNGQTGAIKWRAGGVRSDFDIPDEFRWSRQHNGRIVSHSKHKTVISFLDNATSGKSGGQEPSHEFSRTLIVQLNHPDGEPTTAKLLHHYDRPDRGLSIRRGNLQQLPNGNIWSAWTDGGYMTEFTYDGEPLMEARWYKRCYGNYRGYKFDGWVGRPDWKPDTAALISSTGDVSVTTIYASWNGATEVDTWEFYGETSGSSVEVICRAKRSGFETACIVEGEVTRVRAEALDRDGKILGSSRWADSRRPPGWKASNADGPAPAGIGSLRSTTPSASLTAAIFLNIVLSAILIFIVVRRKKIAPRWMFGSSRGSYSALPATEQTGV